MQDYRNMKIKFSPNVSESDKILIESIINDSYLRVRSFLKIGPVVFNLAIDEFKTIPQWGVGGYGDHSNIELFLEENRPNDWKEHLPRTIYHECHHFVRAGKVNLDDKLADLILSEGLAQHFEIEVDGQSPSFFSNFLNESQRSEMLDTFKVEYNDLSYDHSRWFFGKEEFLFQAGYDFSYFLVDGFLENKKLPASKLVDVSTDEFIEYLNLI